MNDQDNTEIDYEIMDDLPINEHFEWHFFQVGDAVLAENLNDDQIEWQAA